MVINGNFFVFMTLNKRRTKSAYENHVEINFGNRLWQKAVSA